MIPSRPPPRLITASGISLTPPHRPLTNHAPQIAYRKSPHRKSTHRKSTPRKSTPPQIHAPQSTHRKSTHRKSTHRKSTPPKSMSRKSTQPNEPRASASQDVPAAQEIG